MRHDKREFEFSSQTNIPIVLFHVCFVDLNM